MLSKAKAKYIKSLQLKKYRKEEQCFVVEGAKSVVELLGADLDVTLVAATREFIDAHHGIFQNTASEVMEATPADLQQIGSLQTNESAVAVVRMRPNSEPRIKQGEVVLALDDIRDPGNLGTLIRTADWYGITSIIASPETADVYNPKTIQASMGSFLRVNVFYTDLPAFLKKQPLVYGAFLTGDDVHNQSFPDGGVFVIGNESNGISAAVGDQVTRKIRIPRFGGAESLNAGVAAAIILDNVFRSKK